MNDNRNMMLAVVLCALVLIGWSLLELTSRSLFALDHTWLPLCASVASVLCNFGVIWWLGDPRPESIGLGVSVGLLAGFALLFVLVRTRRAAWLAAV